MTSRVLRLRPVVQVLRGVVVVVVAMLLQAGAGERVVRLNSA